MSPAIYPQAYHRTPCHTVLICKGSNKKQKRIRLFQISQKERLSHLLWQQSALEVISQCGSPSCTLPKRTSSTLQFDQEENIPGYSIERRNFETCQDLPIDTDRVGTG